MSWQPEIDEIRKREEFAKQMGGPERVARHHENGRYTVRERMDKLLDKDSFHEIGALAGKAEHDEDGQVTSFMPANFVMGSGKINGRKVVVGGDDFTVRGGAADARVGNKTGHSEKMALHLRLPMIRLVDGTGGGGSVKTLETTGFTYVPALSGWEIQVELMSMVPVVGACMGPVAGLGAVRVANSHFSLMVKESSQLFVAGPPVVERGLGHKIEKEELGGSEIHTHISGAVDNEVENEDEAFDTIAKFLSYMPQSVWEVPPRIETGDYANRREESLIEVVPRDRKRLYDIFDILGKVLDIDSFFEIGPDYAKSLVVGLARLDGYSVGVMANNPKFNGGAIDHHASEKMIRFVDMCDTFHIPIVNFVDNPGFLIGRESELSGTARVGTRALAAVFQATVPWVSIIIRRVYGVAGGGHGNGSLLNLRYAWPSGEWGSLPIEGGVQAAYRREIEAAEDPEAHRRGIEEKLEGVRSPFRTAEAFGVEEIIDPRDTRPLLCDWVESAYKLLPSELGPKTRAMRP